MRTIFPSLTNSKAGNSYDFTFKGELLDGLSDGPILSLDVSFLLGLLFEGIAALLGWAE